MVDVIWSLEKVDRICHQSNGFRRFGKKCHHLYTGDAVMLFVMFCLHFRRVFAHHHRVLSLES